MDLQNRFQQFINEGNLFKPKDKLLLAVSGGVDSVVLCKLCKMAGFDFGIAHCNFQLRGTDSERDEKFVKELAEKNKVCFYTVRFDTKKVSKEKKISTQEAARELRYEWFEEVRKSKGYQFILTAHHADDNVETILMNFFRGSGIKGLRGMEPRRDHIVRPLLFAKRKELEEFLEANKLEYVADYTNLREDYSRNYFRINVIPSIEKIYPGAIDTIYGNIPRFRDIEKLYQQAIAQHKKKLLEVHGNEAHISVLKLKKSDPLQTIVYEIIRDFGFTSRQVPEVLDLLDSESGKYIQSASHRIIKNRNWLIIALKDPRVSQSILIEEAQQNLDFAKGNLQLELIQNSLLPPVGQKNNQCVILDAKEITFPLLLRPWRQGDYFYPLGMKKKKKLARFFIDQKLSKTEKEQTWVLEMNKKIIWVIGMRIDDRFKITEKTKSVLRISLSK
jgi:tRNA(Ile)-lysidine synthase